MGYQQKSYKKFVASAATATLVASAIVPVASAANFSDVSEDSEFKTYIDSLSEKGIIGGYSSDNTFRPNNKLTRGQVAIMLGRWLEKNGETVPTDWATNPRFSDISSSNEELAKYAALVSDAEVFTGVSGKLNPSQNISRQHMAVVLDRVAEQVADVSLVELAEEVEDKTVADLNEANADYRDEIQALVNLGISTVSNFRPTEEVTRAHFAKFLYQTIEIIEEATTPPPTAEELQAEVASIVGTLPELTAITAENAEAAKKTATEATSALAAIETAITEGEYTEEEVAEINEAITEAETAIEAVTKKADEVIEAGKTPVVESVSATNLKQIVVNFSQELNADTAEKVENYAVTVGTAVKAVESAVVSENGKSVVLTLAAATAQQDVANVKVSKVTSKAGVAVAETTKEVTFFDTVAPTVEDVRLVGPRTVELSFSEPMKQAPVVKLDNGSISTTVTLDPNDASKAIVEFGIAPTVGTHELEISGGLDFADFKVSTTVEEFEYVEDTTAPTASISKAEPDQLTIKFSKPVQVKNAANISIYHTVNNSASYAGTNFTAVNPVNGYADTFTADFSTPLPEGNNAVFLNTQANALEDAWGNDVASNTLTAAVVLDKVAPSVTSVTAETDDEFVIKFSEAVNEAQAANIANYELTNAKGEKVSLAGLTPVYDAETNEVTITFRSNLTPGTYSLLVKNIQDTSYAKNKLTSQTISVVVPDTTAWNIDRAVVSGNKIRVTFDEAMSSEGLTNVKNYVFLNEANQIVDLPRNTTLSALNTTTVEFVAPDTEQNRAALAEIDEVRVSGSLKDATGNIYSNVAYATAEVQPDAGPDAVADSGKTTSRTTLSFQVDQELQGSLTPGNFEVVTVAGDGTETLVPGTTFGGASYVNNNGKATITLTLSANQSFDADDTLNVRVKDNALVNTFGTQSDVFTVAITDGIKPSVALADTDGDGDADDLNIVNDAVSPVADFVITYNEALGSVSDLWASDLVIVDQDGKTLKPGDDYSVVTSGSTLVVSLADTDYAGVITVSSVDKPAYIRDATGNTSNAFGATTVTITNSVAAVAAALEIIAAYAADETNSAPTVADYTTAGVTGVTADNLTAVNQAIANLAVDQADTVQEVQAVVNGVNTPVQQG